MTCRSPAAATEARRSIRSILDFFPAVIARCTPSRHAHQLAQILATVVLVLIFWPHALPGASFPAVSRAWSRWASASSAATSRTTCWAARTAIGSADPDDDLLLILFMNLTASSRCEHRRNSVIAVPLLLAIVPTPRSSAGVKKTRAS
ncbi:hypothetical protein [Microbacterium sp.]|uniref:hypothetical protein n=1 Tax=Microbacterium sp. TaxID=51671 RepID=UPI003A92B321